MDVFPKGSGQSFKGLCEVELQDQISLLERPFGSSVVNDLEGMRMETGTPRVDKLFFHEMPRSRI